jgi:FAD-linked oxidoreductase
MTEASAPTRSNWAGEHRFEPAHCERPSTVADVVSAIERAGSGGHVVRVAGSGHSSSDLVSTDGTLLVLDRMNRVLDADRSSGLVRVQAGITLRALSDALWDLGLALENIGDIDVQSLAGATATGTHGTGIKLPTLSARLHAVELACADGSTIEVSDSEDPEAMGAARVSLGSLGVVTAATLQTVEAFTLERVESTQPLDDILDNLDELVDHNDHFGFFTFPHSPLAITAISNRVELAPRPRGRARAWADDILLKNHVFHAACKLGRRQTSLIPVVNRLLSRANGTIRRVDRSYLTLATPRLVPFTELEYAIPRVHAATATRAVRDAIDHGGLDVSFPLEVRFAAADDAFLSPAYGRETCYVTAHMFQGMPAEPFFREVEAIMVALGGRPHWGKQHFRTAEQLRDVYPQWDRFVAVRERLDPSERFTNRAVRRVLGPASTTPGAPERSFGA